MQVVKGDHRFYMTLLWLPIGFKDMQRYGHLRSDPRGNQTSWHSVLSQTHRSMMSLRQQNHRKPVPSLDHIEYPLVNIQKTMENHHVLNGKIQYFYGHDFNSQLLT